MLSPRRVAAKLRALEAMELWSSGLSHRRIAAQLGYKTASGAWRAIQRLLDRHAEWERYERETGRRSRGRREPTTAQITMAFERLAHDLEWNTARMDAERERLRQLLLGEAVKRTRAAESRPPTMRAL